jgi:glycosyltransferase involved in cell wall biosynthesis
LRRSALTVVAPSRWWETGPLTVAEARALGLPAIVSSRAGASEKIRHGYDGFVVEPERQAIADALKSLRSGDVAARMGAAAYEAFWQDPPTPRRHARDLAEVYDAALRSGYIRTFRPRAALASSNP